MESYIDFLILSYLSTVPKAVSAKQILTEVNKVLRKLGYATLVSKDVNSPLYKRLSPYVYSPGKDGDKPIWLVNKPTVDASGILTRYAPVTFDVSTVNSLINQVGSLSLNNNLTSVNPSHYAVPGPFTDNTVPTYNVTTTIVPTTQANIPVVWNIDQSIIPSANPNRNTVMYVDLGNYHNMDKIKEVADDPRTIHVYCYEDAAGNCPKITHPKITYYKSTRAVKDYTDVKMIFDIFSLWRSVTNVKFIMVSKDSLFGTVSLVLEDEVSSNTVKHVTML